MVRVYAAATGRCLYRDTPDLNEAEQNLVSRYFHEGVQLAIEPKQERVIGLLTIVRSTEEPFLFVVDTNNHRPLYRFYRRVYETCEAQSSWNINIDRYESKVLRTIVTGNEEPEQKLVEKLSSKILKPRTTKTYYDGYQDAVTTLAAVTSEIDFDEIASGSILITHQNSPLQMNNINHKCIIKSSEPSNHNNHSRIFEFIYNIASMLNK